MICVIRARVALPVKQEFIGRKNPYTHLMARTAVRLS